MANALLLRPLDWATVTASSTADAARVAANLALDRMGLVWRSATGSATRSLTFDMGSDVAIDTIALFGVAEGTGTGGGVPSIGWSWSIDLATEAQGAFSGSYWSSDPEDVLAGSVLPVSAMGKGLWMAAPGAPAAARHVRLNFAGLGTSAIQIARVCIGAKIQLERNFSYGLALGVRDLGTLDFSPRGTLRRREGRKLRGIGLQFNHVYRDELEGALQRLFERIGNTGALVVATDPTPHAERQNRMYFGMLNGNLGSVLARPGGYRADLNLVALD
jgi:hypothetical protein